MMQWYQLTTGQLDLLKRLLPVYGVPTRVLDDDVWYFLVATGCAQRTDQDENIIQITDEGKELLNVYFNTMKYITETMEHDIDWLKEKMLKSDWD